jgi:hypothetical protein
MSLCVNSNAVLVFGLMGDAAGADIHLVAQEEMDVDLLGIATSVS